MEVTRSYRETERKGRDWPVGPVLWLGRSKKLRCLAVCGLAGDNGGMSYISKKVLDCSLKLSKNKLYSSSCFSLGILLHQQEQILI